MKSTQWRALRSSAAPGIPFQRGIDNQREILLTKISLVLTGIVGLVASWEMFQILLSRINQAHFGPIAEQIVFILLVDLLIYGNFVYQFTRLAYFRRIAAHVATPNDELETCLYAAHAPTLTILVPSYKEEFEVVRSTLLSAMLQDYPNRRIVLLIDDPHDPSDPADKAALQAMRQLPPLLQSVFDLASLEFKSALREYHVRSRIQHIDLVAETSRLARLYRVAAEWFARHGSEYRTTDHAGALFAEKVLCAWHDAHIARAQELEQHAQGVNATRILREYRRLAALFQVEISSFERKRYVNLSHEPNKAMNLNSYIELLGKHWKEAASAHGLQLLQAKSARNARYIPDSDFLITLDADSVLLPDYASKLIHYMLQPGNEKVAVAQTPYSAIPGAPGTLERIAGATTDIQYIIHQGFSRHNATFWVGANALLRKSSLMDIRSVTLERGFAVAKYIQDRTVIEDTESTVDLLERGWRLFNYPERLAYSATPPDFGSLLIQRRRWANGGLIIFPKLLRYLLRGPVSRAKIAEAFFRCHYLGSIAAVNIGLLALLAFPFEQSVESWWLPLTALPYYLLYMRDLIQAGYRHGDLLRVYALNLLLIPINLGGVFKSIQQAVTGCQIPFSRTPKVVGRTSAPAFYIIAEYGLLGVWLAGALFDAFMGRWTHAAFSLVNAMMLGYAIARFIGFSASHEDLLLGIGRKRVPATTQSLSSRPVPIASPEVRSWTGATASQDQTSDTLQEAMNGAAHAPHREAMQS